MKAQGTQNTVRPHAKTEFSRFQVTASYVGGYEKGFYNEQLGGHARKSEK